MGKWQGKSKHDNILKATLAWSPADGESLLQVGDRIRPLVKDILSEVHSGISIPVCTHENIVRLVRMMLDYTDDIQNFDQWVRERLEEPIEHCVPYVYQLAHEGA